MIISPTIRKSFDTGMTVVVAPADLAGRMVVAVDARPCGYPTGVDSMCGLVSGHLGDHWECAAALVESDGPFALTRAHAHRPVVQCGRCLHWVHVGDMDDMEVCFDCARD